MEARFLRAALAVAVVVISTGARYRSANYIVETPNPRHAEQFAAAAEKFRHDLAVSWLGKAMPNWSRPCLMTVRVGPNLGAGGATSFVFDHGEVLGWRMTIQGSHQRILDSVLPHEITHMIFASHFRQPLPRWCDEGGATSVECAPERLRHRKMLVQFLTTGRGIAFNRMFAMKDYPADVMPLYAQGFSLAEYLIQQGGRRKYVAFMGDGLRTNDWSGAIRQHYGVPGMAALQNTWLAWVRQGWPPLNRPAATQPPPAVEPTTMPKTEMLAGREKLPRPRPNLIHHVAAEPTSYAPGSTVPVRTVAMTEIRSKPQRLAASGWHPPGAESTTTVATVESTPGESRPTQLTRPPQFQMPRQRVLQWSRR